MDEIDVNNAKKNDLRCGDALETFCWAFVLFTLLTCCCIFYAKRIRCKIFSCRFETEKSSPCFFPSNESRHSVFSFITLFFTSSFSCKLQMNPMYKQKKARTMGNDVPFQVLSHIQLAHAQQKNAHFPRNFLLSKYT